MYLLVTCWFSTENLPEVVSVVSGVSEVNILLFWINIPCLSVFYIIASYSLYTIKVC